MAKYFFYGRKAYPVDDLKEYLEMVRHWESLVMGRIFRKVLILLSSLWFVNCRVSFVSEPSYVLDKLNKDNLIWCFKELVCSRLHC